MEELTPKPPSGADPEVAAEDLLEGLAELRRSIEAAEDVIDDLTSRAAEGATERQQEISRTLTQAEEALTRVAPPLGEAADLATEENFVGQARAALERETPAAERGAATGEPGPSQEHPSIPPDDRRGPRRIVFWILLLTLAVAAAVAGAVFSGALAPHDLPDWLRPPPPDPAPAP